MKTISIILLFLVMLLAGCSHNKSADELFNDGEKFTTENKYSEAVSSFETLLNDFPDDTLAPITTLRLASIYQNKLVTNITESNSLDKAVRLFYSIHERYPDSKQSPIGLFMAGFIQANELKDFDAATKTYNLFLEKYPDHELATSAREELDNMGLTPEEILKKNISVLP